MAALAAASVGGFRTTLDASGFTEIHTPKVVASATESGANVFPIDWFGDRAFLAQSPQFYKQIMVGVFEHVYEIGPVFRAEPHDTARHLAQYLSLDAEMGFIGDHTDVMATLRDVLAGMTASIAERAGASLELLSLQLPDVPTEIPAIDFVEAQHMIEADAGESVVGEPDLAPAHERWLGEWALREHGSEFVFVVGYPMVKRPFYTHPDPNRPEASKSFDLLFRGLELVTGGQRLHLYDDYLAALHGQDLAPFEGYLEAFRHGMPPHGGFAIGLERWIARLTHATNVREVTLFPRQPPPAHAMRRTMDCANQALSIWPICGSTAKSARDYVVPPWGAVADRFLGSSVILRVEACGPAVEGQCTGGSAAPSGLNGEEVRHYSSVSNLRKFAGGQLIGVRLGDDGDFDPAAITALVIPTAFDTHG